MLSFVPFPWATSIEVDQGLPGFPQQRERLTGRFVLSFPTRFEYLRRRRQGWVNIVNPRRGVLIMGSPGAGKTRFILEPAIRQLIESGTTMMLYDYKYPALTSFAYAQLMVHHKAYEQGISFYTIQFSDIRRSHRCNVIAPQTMKYQEDARTVAETILMAANRSRDDREGEFFLQSAITFVGALIWFLREYEDGRYCTLPHVIELSKLPYEKLFSVVGSVRSLEYTISPFFDAFSHGTMEMLDGQMAAAKIPLSKLSSPDIYYILSGNDVGLGINEPAAPKLMCIGGDQGRAAAVAPVLSLFVERINRICNQPERRPMAIVADEFATVRAPSVLYTIATGRSNNIIPMLAVQDLSQLRVLYSRDETDWLYAISANLFCGQLAGDTARMVSERFPQVLVKRTSVTTNEHGESESMHKQWEPTVTPASIAQLSTGEFVGMVADDPKNPANLRPFHAQMRRQDKDDVKPVELPLIHPDAEKEMTEIYDQIRRDVDGIVADVTRKIMEE